MELLNKIFAHPKFYKGILYAIIVLLIPQVIFGIFWWEAFYYIGVPLGIITLIVMIAIYFYLRFLGKSQSEADETDDVSQRKFVFKSLDEDEDQKANCDFKHITEEDFEDILVEEECVENTESIENEEQKNISDDSNFEELEKSLSEDGKLFLREWRAEYQKCEEAISTETSEEITARTVRLNSLAEKIKQDREETAKAAEEAKAEEVAEKLRVEENRKQLEEAKAYLSF